MSESPEILKLRAAVKRLVKAEVEYAWRGAGHPEDIDGIERERLAARQAYHEAVAALEKRGPDGSQQ